MVRDRWKVKLPEFRQNFVFSNSGEPLQILAPVSCSYLTGMVLCCCSIFFILWLQPFLMQVTVACLFLGTSLPSLFLTSYINKPFLSTQLQLTRCFLFFGPLSIKGCKRWMAVCENPSRSACQWMISVIQIEGNSWLRKNSTGLKRLWKTKWCPVEFS